MTEIDAYQEYIRCKHNAFCKAVIRYAAIGKIYGCGRKNDIITDEVKAFIMKCLDSDQKAPRKQQHTAHKIYTRLVAECGFDGCEASVRRTVAELKGKVSNVFVPLSYDPAEAVQVDWGEATVILGGIKQKIQIWCMRECHSGDIFVSAFYRQNEESFLEGIVKGLEHFGGTPQKIIFDNARVAVKEGFGCHAKATDKYLSLSAHYSFKPVFCNPAQGHENGLVEGLVGLVRRNFFVPVPKATPHNLHLQTKPPSKMLSGKRNVPFSIAKAH